MSVLVVTPAPISQSQVPSDLISFNAAISAIPPEASSGLKECGSVRTGLDIESVPGGRGLALNRSVAASISLPKAEFKAQDIKLRLVQRRLCSKTCSVLAWNHQGLHLDPKTGPYEAGIKAL